MAHTPGPWYALPGLHNISIRHKTGDKYFPMINVASVRGRFGTDCPYGQSDSNVRLIVAAPDLLEALQSIAECCDEDQTARDYASRQTEIRGIARAAIAKATGKQ